MSFVPDSEEHESRVEEYLSRICDLLGLLIKHQEELTECEFTEDDL